MENVYDRREFKFSDVVAVSAKTGTNPQLGTCIMCAYNICVYIHVYKINVFLETACSSDKGGDSS